MGKDFHDFAPEDRAPEYCDMCEREECICDAETEQLRDSQDDL